MTTKAAFSPEEWTMVLEGPPTAGMIVLTAAHGGTFRETIAMSKAYAEARAEHGESELLDEIVSAKPRSTTRDITRLKSSGTTGSGTSATPWRCWRAKRPPRNSMITGTFVSPSPARSPPPTGSTGRA
jgi:hypothetical protein